MLSLSRIIAKLNDDSGDAARRPAAAQGGIVEVDRQPQGLKDQLDHKLPAADRIAKRRAAGSVPRCGKVSDDAVNTRMRHSKYVG